MVYIINSLGGTIKEDTSLDAIGEVCVNSDGSFSIGVSCLTDKDIKVRLCILLGHVILNSYKVKVLGKFVYNSNNYDYYKECEAKEFASVVLLGDVFSFGSKLRDYTDIEGNIDVSSLATYYGVGCDIVLSRLKYLGLVD